MSPSVEVKALVTKQELLEALARLTLFALDFDAKDWCSNDAKLLEDAAAVIRRELKRSQEGD